MTKKSFLLLFSCLVILGCGSKKYPKYMPEDMCDVSQDLYTPIIFCLDKASLWNIQVDDVRYVQHYKTGEVAAEIEFSDGLRNGDWKLFYKNGKPKAMLSYLSGGLFGVYREYYDSGKIRLAVKEVSLLTDSCFTTKIHTTIDPVLQTKIVEIDTIYGDKLEGIYTYFYPDGGKQKVYKVENCNVHGIYAFYHHNSSLMFEEHYVHGKREGISTSFDSTGKPISIDLYKNDLLIKHLYPCGFDIIDSLIANDNNSELIETTDDSTKFILSQ